MTAHVYPVTAHGFAGPEGRPNQREWELATPSSPGRRTLAEPPRRFPSSINGSAAWSAGNRRLFGPSTLELGPAGVAEVEQALKHFLGIAQDSKSNHRHKTTKLMLIRQILDWTEARRAARISLFLFWAPSSRTVRPRFTEGAASALFEDLSRKSTRQKTTLFYSSGSPATWVTREVCKAPRVRCLVSRLAQRLRNEDTERMHQLTSMNPNHGLSLAKSAMAFIRTWVL